MLTFVGLYAGATFSSCVRVVLGASAAQPSSSVLESCAGAPLERPPSDLKPVDDPPTWVGVNAGFDAAGGGGARSSLALDAVSPEYLDPDASATLRIMLSGVRSRSLRAVICT